MFNEPRVPEPLSQQTTQGKTGYAGESPASPCSVTASGRCPCAENAPRAATPRSFLLWVEPDDRGVERARVSDPRGIRHEHATSAVTLPNRAVGQFTTSAQYAVYAARYAYEVSGQKIAIIGHSQGGLWRRGSRSSGRRWRLTPRT